MKYLVLLACVAIAVAIMIWQLDGPDTEVPRVVPGGTATTLEDADETSTGESRSDPTSGGSASKAEHRGPNGYHIEGQVIDGQGEPVPRFTIEARPRRDVQLWRSEGTVTRDYEDPEGVFRLGPLARGEWILIAKGPQDRRSAPRAWLLPSEDGSGLVLELFRVATLSGAVRGHHALPVAGAGVYVVYPGEDWPTSDFGRPPPEPIARTDSGGLFLIHGVQPGTAYVFATHAEYCDSEAARVAVPPGGFEEVTLELREGGRVTGHLDPSVGEVSNREIRLYSFRGSIGWREVRADKAGRFSIERVIPQDYVIELSGGMQIKSGESICYRKPVTVQEGRTTKVIFGERGQPIRVYGVVRYRGHPFAGASLDAMMVGAGSYGDTTPRTGSDGSYELMVPEPGKYRFTINAGTDPDTPFYRSVEDRDVVEMSFDLPGGAIVGRVVAPDGEPLGSILVTLERSPADTDDAAADFWERYWEARSNVDGTFEFRLLPAGLYTLRAPDGHWRLEERPRVPHGRAIAQDIRVEDAPAPGLVLRLRPGGRIAGRVLDSSGVPVVAAWIRVRGPSGLELSAYWAARTDIKGRFEVPCVAPGTYTVFAYARKRWARSTPVAVVAERTSETQIELR